MLPSIVAEVRDGQIHPLEPTTLPEGARVLITLLSTEEDRFWQEASQAWLASVWADEKDDVYAQLLKE